MKIPVKQLASAGRLLAVMITVCALVMCGATAAERQAEMIAAQQSADQARATDSDLLEPSPGETARGEMETGEAPNVEPAAWLVPTGIAKTGNDDPRLSPDTEQSTQASSLQTTDADAPATTPSPTRVHTSLGRQFTLVGAKPSGTS